MIAMFYTTNTRSVSLAGSETTGQLAQHWVRQESDAAVLSLSLSLSCSAALVNSYSHRT